MNVYMYARNTEPRFLRQWNTQWIVCKWATTRQSGKSKRPALTIPPISDTTRVRRRFFTSLFTRNSFPCSVRRTKMLGKLRTWFHTIKSLKCVWRHESKLKPGGSSRDGQCINASTDCVLTKLVRIQSNSQVSHWLVRYLISFCCLI